MKSKIYELSGIYNNAVSKTIFFRTFQGVICHVFIFLACSAQLFANNWNPKAPVPAPGGRVYATGFSIGNKGYIGVGEHGPNQDFWEWDQASNVWTQKADFGGGPRYVTASFSIGTKGYIGTGFDGGSDYQDLWEWNQATNVWTKKANFVGARDMAVGFSIGTKGYIGTGEDDNASVYKDLWEWDPATNVWTQKADFTGGPRQFAVAFSIGSKGYIGTGGTNDFWEWDQASNLWTKKADLPGVARSNAVGFSFSGKKKGYIGTGADKTGAPLADFWEWDQATNVWTQKKNYGGGPVWGAVGFSIGDKGYIGTGSLDASKGIITDDFWEYSDTTCLFSGTIFSDPSTTVCVGQQVHIHASGGGAYSWSTGETTSYIVTYPTITATYSVTVANTSGCTGIIALTIPVDTGCAATGTDAIYLAQEQVSVMPNPFRESALVIVTHAAQSELHEMKIFDMLGKEVRDIHFSGEQFLLERGDLKEGIYFYKLYLKNKNIVTGKFIVTDI